MTPKEPNRYIVRVWSSDCNQCGQVSERQVFAFSAEDAHFQVELELKKTTPRVGYVSYVGPYNANCRCLNDCRCGLEARVD